MIQTWNITRQPVLTTLLVGVSLLFWPHIASGQDCIEEGCVSAGCTNGSKDDTNIFDLGSGYYGTMQGGLYPGGTNTRPATHNTAGLILSDEVAPRDDLGVVNYATGKIVLLSIGFSNAQYEFDFFREKVDQLDQVNPYLVVVNGAIGGWPIEDILADPATYMVGVQRKLDRANVKIPQVQAIWFKTANLGPDSGSGASSYIDQLREQYVQGMDFLHTTFPNARLCYVSDRTFGGYSEQVNDEGNPWPYCYWTGWAMKQLIEQQINGDLDFDGETPVAPWISWGPYLWADGATPRSDGLEWLCQDFCSTDRRHPSFCGRDKVANKLLGFFTTDQTTMPWFYRTRLVNVGGGVFDASNSDRFNVDKEFSEDGDYGHSGTTTTTTTTHDILNTVDDVLYQDVRRGSSFSYHFTVPLDGNYQVTCYFQDPQATSAGQRIFDVKAEGNVKVPNGLDIFAQVGQWTAHTETFDADVEDGELTLDFVATQGSQFPAIVSAIAVDYKPSLSKRSVENTPSDDFPSVSELDQNYPNPFNPATTIHYSIPNPGYVTIKVFDLIGNEVEILVSGQKGAGTHSVRWDATGKPSGVYFYRLEAGDYRETRKLIVLR